MSIVVKREDAKKGCSKIRKPACLVDDVCEWKKGTGCRNPKKVYKSRGRSPHGSCSKSKKAACVEPCTYIPYIGCRNLKKPAIVSSKPCAPGKRRSRLTGRCIKENGRFAQFEEKGYVDRLVVKREPLDVKQADVQVSVIKEVVDAQRVADRLALSNVDARQLSAKRATLDRVVEQAVVEEIKAVEQAEAVVQDAVEQAGNIQDAAAGLSASEQAVAAEQASALVQDAVEQAEAIKQEAKEQAAEKQYGAVQTFLGYVADWFVGDEDLYSLSGASYF